MNAVSMTHITVIIALVISQMFLTNFYFGDSGQNQTLDLGIVSQLLNHCAAAAGKVDSQACFFVLQRWQLTDHL